MSRPKLSAVAIVLNEERNLPGLIESLRWVDEIVVVDGGSTDRTVEIARHAGVRCHRRPFDNYAAQRNFAADQATGDWVLTIDADERPTRALAAEIRQRLADQPAAAYRIPIRSKIFARPFRFSGTQDDLPIRLYDRRFGQWRGEVHERLHVAGAVETTAAHLEHETIPDLSSFLAKMHRYTNLSADAAVAARVAPRWGASWQDAGREILRRLIFKFGWLDGPEGWAFCLLSGLSAWVAAQKHRRRWEIAQRGR